MAAPIDPIVQALCDRLRQRSEVGIRKYGVTLARTDLSLRDWQAHMLDELLDGALYLLRMMQEPDLEPAPALPAYVEEVGDPDLGYRRATCWLAERSGQ